MEFEYYTFPGGSQSLIPVFNAVAMICGDADYAGLMQLGSILGLLVTLIIAVYKVDVKDSFVYLLVVCALWFGLMVPKSDVVIIESSGHNMAPVAHRVSNIPFGLAVSSSLISKIGMWATQKTELVFTLPDDMNYSETGMLFGSRLYRQIHNSNLHNPRLQNDWATFMHQCSFFDINQYNYYSLDELLNTPDILITLGKTNKMLYTVVSKDGQSAATVAMPCNQAYQTLKTRTGQDITQSVMPKKARQMLTHLGWIDNAGPNPTDIYNTMGDATINYMFGTVSSNAQTAITQAAMSNMVKNAEIRNASAMGNTSTVEIALANAQAERQWVISQLTGFNQASSFLPVMRTTLEGILIGVFPFVMVIALLAGVMALRSVMFYFMSLFWLQLWAPIAAIMNMIMTSYSASNIYSELNGYDLQSMRSSIGVLKAAVEGEAMAGYAFWLIPMISFALVMGGRGLANGMIGLISSGQSVGNAAGSQVAAGNASVGNTSHNNSTANKSSTDAVYADPGTARASSSVGGYNWTSGQPDSLRAQVSKHDLPVSGSSTIKASDMYSQQATQSIQAGQQQEAVASAATTLANSQALGYMAQVGRDSSAGKEIASRLSADQRQAVNEVLQAANKIDDQFKIGQQSQTASSVALSLGLRGDAGANAKVVRANLGASLGSEGSAKNTDEYARAIVNAATALQQRGISFDQSLASAISNSDSFRQSLSQGDSLAQSTQASLSQAQTATQSAKTHFAQAEGYQEAAQQAAESNVTITVDNSAAAGNALLQDGQTLSKAYQEPANTAAIGGAAQQGLQSKQALEDSTRGTAFSPEHSLQATDRPVNEVGTANARHQAQVKSGTATAFGHVEQQANQAGLSRPGVQQQISGQASTLGQQSSQKTGEIEQTINQTGSTLESDAAHQKQSFENMHESTSVFQRMNSSIMSQSDGSDGSGYNMVKEVGLPTVQGQTFKAPDGSAPAEGFTDGQARIQQENSQPLKQLGQKLGLTSDSITYTVKPKQGDNSDPKP